MVQARRSLLLEHTLVDRIPGLVVAETPEVFPDPQLLLINSGLAATLGLEAESLERHAESWLGGRALPEGAMPVATAYAGHQFGHLTPSLGDGRAVLLGEIVAPSGERFDLQLKGSGPTPFSRGGDGRAALDSVLREYLISEAMHALGIPTTRALAAITTGETLRRDRPAPGAVLARTASSHLRIGTLEYLAIRQDHDNLRRVVAFALQRHHADALGQDPPALALLRAVAGAQAGLVARWMQVGFVHGVMNTDNMTLSGETLDYGPCAFMDATDPGTVFSRVDTTGRYAFGRQPSIALWNLARMAEALLPLIDPDLEAAIEQAQEVLRGFHELYRQAWVEGMARKLGIPDGGPDDLPLIDDLLQHLHEQALDYTSSFRRLAQDLRAGRPALGDPELADWQDRWTARLGRAEPQDVAEAMDAVNPLYIPRNQRVEEALTAAVRGDLQPFHTLLEVLSQPFVEQPGRERYAEPPPPSFCDYQTHCNT